MTPREELQIIIDESGDTESLYATIRKKLAIGKWVPVSERLPDTGERTYWDGIVLQDGDVEIGTFGDDSFRPESSNITHWLELDIPEVETD